MSTEGASDGNVEGAIESRVVGEVDGPSEVADDGAKEGSCDGSSEGGSETADEGVPETADGAPLGSWSVGASESTLLGLAEGLVAGGSVGRGVESCVGGNDGRRVGEGVAPGADLENAGGREGADLENPGGHVCHPFQPRPVILSVEILEL